MVLFKGSIPEKYGSMELVFDQQNRKADRLSNETVKIEFSL